MTSALKLVHIFIVLFLKIKEGTKDRYDDVEKTTTKVVDEGFEDLKWQNYQTMSNDDVFQIRFNSRASNLIFSTDKRFAKSENYKFIHIFIQIKKLFSVDLFIHKC